MNKSGFSYHETGSCEIAARLDHVADVSKLLRDFCRRKCLDETMWPQIDLALCECLNNAIEHGAKEDPTKTVRVRWQWIDSTLHISVEDPGEHYQPTGPAELPTDSLSESGRGYFIIDSIAQSVSHQKTEYGHQVTIQIDTHQPSDIIDQMEEAFELSQGLTNELNITLIERDLLSGLAQDLAHCPVVEKIIENGVERLRGILQITQVDVWKKVSDDTLENAYHEGPEPLAIKEAIVAPDLACSCLTSIATETEQFVEDCSVLPHTDPLYSESGCALVCPIIYQKDCLGAIAIHATPSEQKLLVERLLPCVKVFADFLSLAYTSDKTFKERQDQERSKTQLEVASEIQRSLLPSKYPNNNHCRTIGRCQAAMAVGGDYFDTVEIRESGLLIVIADVMGKGVPAALLATIFRTAIRSRLNLAETPGWLLSKINKQIHDELGHLNMFVTAQAAFFDYGKKMLKLASAGHCPALMLNPDFMEVESLAAEGMPLGIDPSDIYEERLIQLKEGSRLLFLTDGIYEAENTRGELLGLDKISEAVPSFWKDGIEFVPQKAFDFVEKFANGRSATDDQTLMALEIL